MSVPGTLGVLCRMLQVSSGYYNIKFPSSPSRAFSLGECSPEKVNISILYPAFCEFKKVEVNLGDSKREHWRWSWHCLSADQWQTGCQAASEIQEIPFKLRNTSYCESGQSLEQVVQQCCDASVKLIWKVTGKGPGNPNLFGLTLIWGTKWFLEVLLNLNCSMVLFNNNTKPAEGIFIWGNPGDYKELQLYFYFNHYHTNITFL